MEILAKNLLILASAGSGKTYQLGNRVIGLVARGAPPERIVALTFTRKAAGEFADSVLTKLAAAACDPQVASELGMAIGLKSVDFASVLETVVRALPRFTLGTIDGFFAKIVKGFQYELGLTGGRFELLEGPQAAAAADEMLAAILGDALNHRQGEEFYHAFRRATIGREDHGVLDPLRKFVSRWQDIYREKADFEWGPASLSTVDPGEWAKQKSAMAARVRSHIDEVGFNRKGQDVSFEESLCQLEEHVIGGGSLGKVKTLTQNILDAVATQSGSLWVKSYKEFEISGAAAAALREWVGLAAECELSAALHRTRAVREVVALFDDLCARRLRNNGLLGFSDVKFLMGEWSRTEDARLRREAVDFRLDSRIDHWLLDEFQDTSRSDWKGLQPLIDEASSSEDSSVFIVGDRKQAIYGWRGGDVGLFGEVIDYYGDGFLIEPMDESFRSCPQVLELVNRVCGDRATLEELFGPVSQRWEWHDHVSAAPLTQPGKGGEARVEVVGPWEDRLERLVGILNELEVGRREMTCGILLRSNSEVREVTDHLRLHGFDVIEEGRRVPAKDNPVGIVVSHLLEWLADPANVFAREVVEMSPLAAVLRASHGQSWREIWESLTAGLSRDGIAETIGQVVAAAWDGWSDFSCRRAGDLLSALSGIDSSGVVSPAEAADWIKRLEVSQSPGVAAVQVMTIHKSKGLGFDVVILPEIPADNVPQSQYFEVAIGPDWLSQTPAKWARNLIPAMREAEERWSANQQYEAFCMLYVALTRAKRGLYVMLDIPPKTSEPDRPSLANWLARATGAETELGIVWQSGTPGWSAGLPMLAPAEETPVRPEFSPESAIQRRSRMRPSAAKAEDHAPTRSPSGMKFGSMVHELLEKISWTDELSAALPDDAAGAAVQAMLSKPEVQSIFHRGGRSIELFREQAVDAILNGQWLSGVIDRLHLHRGTDGIVEKIEIIDFKTDGVSDPSELVARYAGQVNAYRIAMAKAYPSAEIECLLLSVRHGCVVRVESE